MRSIRHLNPMLRASGVIAVVVILTTGVTFAVLNNQAVLADNDIVSESAALRVNNDPNDTTFSVTETGFQFTGIVPGTPTPPANAKTFQLRNVSGAGVPVNAKVTGATLPTGVNGDQITFTFTPTDPAGAAVTATWDELSTTDGKQVLPNLAPGEQGTQNMTVNVDISGTVNAATVNIQDFDLVFGTVAVVPAG